LPAALSILTLPVAMIELSFRALLVPAVSTATLVQTSLPAAGQTAIALPTVATRAEKE
jgi:hypothetical protein